MCLCMSMHKAEMPMVYDALITKIVNLSQHRAQPEKETPHSVGKSCAVIAWCPIQSLKAWFQQAKQVGLHEAEHGY